MTPQQKPEISTQFDDALRTHNELVDLLGAGSVSSNPQPPYWEIGPEFEDRIAEIIEELQLLDPDFPVGVPQTQTSYGQSKGSSASISNDTKT